MEQPKSSDKKQNTYMAESQFLYGDSTFRLLVDQITDYAIFLLTPGGEVATWNPGAERIKGFRPVDIIGKHFRTFYPREEQEAKKPEYELEVAAETGRFEDEGWRIRKDGSRFWASVIITAIHDPSGQLIGYGKVTRDLTERKRTEEQLRELSRRVLRSQDEERGRLGRELHDTIGQYLVAAKMSLDSLVSDQSLDSEQTRRQILEMLPIVERAICEVRTLSYLLYPPMLEEMGLSSAIRWHLDGFSKRSGIRVNCDIADDVRLSRDAELALFRVLQESLTNVHRHSQSETAHVRFELEENEAFLEVQDQGTGMKPVSLHTEDSAASLGVGIRGMTERIRQLGGKLEIRSSSEGTTVQARVPVDVPIAVAAKGGQ
jgi:PAS domain S-box-containing protein